MGRDWFTAGSELYRRGDVDARTHVPTRTYLLAVVSSAGRSAADLVFNIYNYYFSYGFLFIF